MSNDRNKQEATDQLQNSSCSDSRLNDGKDLSNNSVDPSRNSSNAVDFIREDVLAYILDFIEDRYEDEECDNVSTISNNMEDLESKINLSLNSESAQLFLKKVAGFDKNNHITIKDLIEKANANINKCRNTDTEKSSEVAFQETLPDTKKRDSSSTGKDVSEMCYLEDVPDGKSTVQIQTNEKVNLKKAEINNLAALTAEQKNKIIDMKLEFHFLQKSIKKLELDIDEKEKDLRGHTTALKKEQEFRLKINEIKEKIIRSTKLKERKVLESNLEQVKKKLDEAREKLNEKNMEETNLLNELKANEKVLANQAVQYVKLKDLRENTVKRLAHLDQSLLNIHESYERLKLAIEGYKTTEEILKSDLSIAENNYVCLKRQFEATKKRAENQIFSQIERVMENQARFREKEKILNNSLNRLETKQKTLKKTLKEKNLELQQLKHLYTHRNDKKNN